MKLGDLGTFKTGGTPSRSKNEYWGDKYPWISSTALGDVYIDENAATDWISDEGLKNSSTKLIKANSLMIGIRIGVGKCSINRIPMCTSQDVVSIEGIDTERYYLPYITTLINNKRHYLESLKRGATIQGITTDIIKNLQIPDIQINRQKLIADTIQVVDDMVCLSHKQLAKLDTLVKSRFIEMFGDPNEMDKWPCRKVKDVADVTVGLVIKPTRFYTDDIKNGIKAFRSLNVREMRVNDSDWVYFSKEGNDQNKKSQLQKGDVLIVRSGYPGTSCVVTDDYEGCNAIDIIIARPKQDIINPYYLCAFNNYPHGMNQILHGTGGAAQKHFNVGAYNNVTIPLPPKEEQNKFVEFMQQADKSKLVLQKLLEKQELLRAALMQEYFG